MAKKDRIYRKMAGRTIMSLYAKSLWQAKDHLLYVNTLFFKESYKRFYFDDIQCIFLQRTQSYLAWSFIWGGLTVILGLVLLLLPGLPIAGLVPFLLFLFALIVNMIMGPSCVVHLQTAVQLQKLACLKRVRRAEKVLARIKSLVEAKQGEWQKVKSVEAQQSVLMNAQEKMSNLQDAVPIDVFHEDRQQHHSKGPYKAMLHQVLFGSLLFLGVIATAQIFFKSLPIGLVGALFHGIILLVVIISLVRWFRHLKGTLIAKFNWLALVFISVYTVIGYFLFMVVSFQNPEVNYHHWAMFQMMFDLQMSDHSLAYAGNIIYAGGCLLLGAAGLVVVQRNKHVASGECLPESA